MPPLVELPTELLDHVLKSANCLSDLRALSIACRRIYSILRNNRADILYPVLAVELGPDVLYDAIGLSHFQPIAGDSSDKPAYPHQFRDASSAYGAYLIGQESDNSLLPPRLSLDCVLRLVRTYRAVALVTDAYISCAIRLFPVCPGADGSVTDLVAPPSRSERLRVLRAHYRLQIVLSLWGSRAHPRRTRHARRTHALSVERLSFALFGLWEPWEVQQLFCAGMFYARIRCVLARHLGPQDSSAKPLTTTMRLTFDEFRDIVRDVSAVDKNAWQWVLDDVSSFPSGGSVAAGTEESIGLRWFRHRLSDALRRQGLPERHRFPGTLRFEGDHVSTVPFSWVDAFDGQYGWNFGGAMLEIRRDGQPTQGLWSRTGYIMWDKPRVEVLKTSALLSHVSTGWARRHGRRLITDS